MEHTVGNENGRRHEIPRTFREVGLMLGQIMDEQEEIKEQQAKIIARLDRFVNILVVSILCPIIVSVAISFFAKSLK